MIKNHVNRRSAVLLCFPFLIWLLAACQAALPEPETLGSEEIELAVPIEIAAPTVSPSSTQSARLTETRVIHSATSATPKTARPTEISIPTPRMIAGSWEGKLAIAMQRFDTNEDGVIDFDDAVHIYRLEIETSELEQLTSGNHRDINPSWSPDGDKIVFTSNRTGNFELFVMKADGTDLKQLTDTTEDELSPSWSPDGDKIAYVIIKTLDSGLQERGLRVILLADDNFQDLPMGPGNIYHPGWSPDGRFLLFEREDMVQSGDERHYKRNTYLWDMRTESILQFDLEGSVFQNVDLLSPKWLPREGYFLSFFYEERFSDTPSAEVKIYEMLEEEGLLTLNEIYTIKNASDPYIWGPNGEWYISFVYNDYAGFATVDLERLPIDYSAHPPTIDFYISSSSRERVMENIYSFSEPDWSPR